MTICIAAMCRWDEASPTVGLQVPIIVGAADRMLTAGDTQYEPPQRKVFGLTTKIIVMIAGDAGVHVELMANTTKTLSSLQTPTVKDAAENYAKALAVYRRKDAEARILAPMGLTFEEFTARQAQLAPTIAEQLGIRLQRYELEVEAILAGVDADGPHIYIVRDPGTFVCRDYIGFGAIGIGASHAESQFMFAKYSRDWHFANASFLTYAAKKRAEVAPGVGKDTDMFYCDLTQQYLAFPEFVDAMEKIYKQVQRRTKRVTKYADGEAVNYVATLLEKAKQAQQAASAQQGGAN